MFCVLITDVAPVQVSVCLVEPTNDWRRMLLQILGVKGWHPKIVSVRHKIANRMPGSFSQVIFFELYPKFSRKVLLVEYNNAIRVLRGESTVVNFFRA